MGVTPWYTSTDLIEAVQRKIAMPLNQRTFTSTDILRFANEEMMISQVPDILRYHQEYFVWSDNVLLLANQQRYPIPERAMGMKCRDIFYVDTNGNLFEMTRINPDDKAYWQRESAVINLMQKYYLESNDAVLAPQNIQSPTGYLRFSYFIRPNQLVDNSRAAILQSFFQNITIGVVNPGDTLNVGNLIFTAVSGAPGALQFQVGGTPTITATNIANAINLDGTYSGSNGSAILSIFFTSLLPLITLSQDLISVTKTIASINITASANMIVSPQLGLQFNGTLPSNITASSLVDFLKTRPGHGLYSKDIIVQSISTNSATFNLSDIPPYMVIGDYICSQYECIIPMIPTDLHNGLAERVCLRILSAQGDAQGLQISQGNLASIKSSEATLTENRIDGSTQKVTQRKSPLSFLRMGIRRRI